MALLRRSSRAVAASLLLVWMWGLPHLSTVDDLCVIAGEEHDAASHVITDAPGTEDPGHCAACHWLRTVKPEVGEPAVALAAVPRGAEPFLSSSSTHRDPAGDRLPARAPPSAVT